MEVELGAELERVISRSWWRLGRELPSDLSRTGSSVLKTLSAEGAQRITVLAGRETVAQPTMSAIIQRLERRGLVSRRRDPRDGRANLVEITALGKQALQARELTRARWFARKLASLDAQERDALTHVLRMLASVLDEPACED